MELIKGAVFIFVNSLRAATDQPICGLQLALVVVWWRHILVPAHNALEPGCAGINLVPGTQ